MSDRDGRGDHPDPTAMTGDAGTEPDGPGLDGPEPDGTAITADAIDEAFVPRQRDGVASVELDGETVLAVVVGEHEAWQTHCLDPVGTVVWKCFDGTAPIDELVADLSDAFETDIEVVRNDVLEMARQLGRAGLLSGVAPEMPDAAHEWYEPEGLPVGVDLPPFRLPDLDGTYVALEDFRGRRILLVNWSPGCGFCRHMAHELVAVQDELAARDIELVLVAFGNADDNRALLAENGLACRLLLQDDAVVEAFHGLGTPAAYFVNREGKVASMLAVGASAVPVLARSAASAESGTD